MENQQRMKKNLGFATATSLVVGCVIGALACLYSLSGEFDLLTDLGVFSCWIFYTLTFACVIRLRRIHPDWQRTYRVPLYPVIPVLAILGGLYVIVSQLCLSGTRATVMALCSVGITLAELEFGVYNSARPQQNQLALMAFLARIEVMPFDADAAGAYGMIRADLTRKGRQIGANDLLIAAHAKALGLTLVTNNTREFERVEGLKLENWV